MSFRVDLEKCIGCGGCEYACPTNALSKTDGFLGTFAIDPFKCDDCGLCVQKCPENAIEPDPEWPVCRGHGCPLKSKKLADVECAVWQQTCDHCGTTLWKGQTGNWECPRCGAGMRLACPKTRKLGHSPVELN